MPPLIHPLRTRVLSAVLGFGRWWLEELRGALPAIGSLPIGKGARADIRPGRTGVELIRITQGEGQRFIEAKSFAAFEEENWHETGTLITGHRARILLTTPQIHLLRLTLPKVARRHLRSTIPLQLRDHAPVLPELLDWVLVDSRIEDERLLVRVVIVRLSTLDEIERGFLEHGLAQPPIHAELDDGRLILLRHARRSARKSSVPRPWAIATALLLSTPLWVMLGLHLLITREESRVAHAEDLAQPRLAAERRFRHKADLATALHDVLAIPSATGLVEDLATRIPATAYAVDMAGRDDGSVAFTLDTADPDLLRPALDHDSLLPGLHEIDQSKTDAGTIRIRYEATVR